MVPLTEALSAGAVWGVAAACAALLWALYRRAYRTGTTTRRATDPAPDQDANGSVYVLDNPAYPGRVKIGQTRRDAQERARELSAHTGVPEPFRVQYALEVADPAAVEREVHRRLADHLVNPDREFFDVDVSTARRTIEQVAGVAPRRAGPVWRRLLGAGLGGLGTGLILGTVLSPSGSTGAAFDRLSVLRDALGYPALLPGMLIALWGWVLLRRRPLRPLLVPSGCVLALSVLGSVAAGWAGHALGAEAIGWGGQQAFATDLAPWAGTWGRHLAGWGRSALGPLGSLFLLAGATGGVSVLLVQWYRRPTKPF